MVFGMALHYQPRELVVVVPLAHMAWTWFLKQRKQGVANNAESFPLN
jgi:hypothetical protein